MMRFKRSSRFVDGSLEKQPGVHKRLVSGMVSRSRKRVASSSWVRIEHWTRKWAANPDAIGNNSAFQGLDMCDLVLDIPAQLFPPQFPLCPRFSSGLNRSGTIVCNFLAVEQCDPRYRSRVLSLLGATLEYAQLVSVPSGLATAALFFAESSANIAEHQQLFWIIGRLLNDCFPIRAPDNNSACPLSNPSCSRVLIEGVVLSHGVLVSKMRHVRDVLPLCDDPERNLFVSLWRLDAHQDGAHLSTEMPRSSEWMVPGWRSAINTASLEQLVLGSDATRFPELLGPFPSVGEDSYRSISFCSARKSCHSPFPPTHQPIRQFIDDPSIFNGPLKSLAICPDRDRFLWRYGIMGRYRSDFFACLAGQDLGVVHPGKSPLVQGDLLQLHIQCLETLFYSVRQRVCSLEAALKASRMCSRFRLGQSQAPDYSSDSSQTPARTIDCIIVPRHYRFTLLARLCTTPGSPPGCSQFWSACDIAAALIRDIGLLHRTSCTPYSHQVWKIRHLGGVVTHTLHGHGWGEAIRSARIGRSVKAVTASAMNRSSADPVILGRDITGIFGPHCGMRILQCHHPQVRLCFSRVVAL